MPSERSISGAYLDHAASTPLMPEVLDEMRSHLGETYANPSGMHRAARAARRTVDDAREALANVVACEPSEVIFTSGGTEADNLAILGRGDSARAGSVLVSAIEHHAVLRPAASIGAGIIPVTREGVVDLERLAAILDPSIALVSVMALNNEVGTLQPLEEIVALVRERAPDALIHSDAVQAFAFCDVAELTRDCDLVSYSAHKIGGPRGAGALVVRARARSRLHPLLRGGPQEGELRAGTENVVAIDGFARAALITAERRPESVARIARLRDRFVDGVIREIPDASESVERRLRHAGNAHLEFPGTVNEEFLLALDQLGVAASSGSSCASGAIEPSHVLLAMGMSPAQARSCIRFSLGAQTTEDEIDFAIDAVVTAHSQISAGTKG